MLGSALGGLVSYLRTLLLDRDLLPAGTFARYCPLREGDSLLLDGQVWYGVVWGVFQGVGECP